MNQLSLKVGQYDLVVFIQQSKEGDRVALKPICEALGIKWNGQHTKLKSSSQYNYADICMVAEDGKQRVMSTIPVDELGLFLCRVNPSKVSEAVRGQLTAFQKNLQVVIDRAIRGGITGDMMTVFSEMVAKMREEMRSEYQGQINVLQERLDDLEEVSYSNAGKMLSNAKKNYLKLVS